MVAVRSDSGSPVKKVNKKVTAPKNTTYKPFKAPVRAKVTAPSGATTSTYSGQRYTTPPAPQKSGGSYGGGAAPSGGGGYGGGAAPSGGYGGGAAAFSAPAPPPPSRWEDLDPNAQKEYLNTDATYMAQQGSLQQELENLIAELALQRKNYGAEHGNTLRNLGWSQELNAFDPENALGAYGMSFGNLQDDFASRGMLDSSAFAEGLGNLNTSFNTQLSDINNAKGRFENELTTREQGAKESHTQDLNRARADAIARRAARLGLV